MGVNVFICSGTIEGPLSLTKNTNGEPYCKFTVKVRRITTKIRNDYLPHIAWGMDAEYINRNFETGSRIEVQSQWQSRITNAGTVSLEARVTLVFPPSKKQGDDAS